MQETRKLFDLSWTALGAVFLALILAGNGYGSTDLSVADELSLRARQLAVADLNNEEIFIRYSILKRMQEKPTEVRRQLAKLIRVYEEGLKSGTISKRDESARVVSIFGELKLLTNDLYLSFRRHELVGIHAETVVLLAKTYEEILDRIALENNLFLDELLSAIDRSLSNRLER